MSEANLVAIDVPALFDHAKHVAQEWGQLTLHNAVWLESETQSLSMVVEHKVEQDGEGEWIPGGLDEFGVGGDGGFAPKGLVEFDRCHFTASQIERIEEFIAGYAAAGAG